VEVEFATAIDIQSERQPHKVLEREVQWSDICRAAAPASLPCAQGVTLLKYMHSTTCTSTIRRAPLHFATKLNVLFIRAHRMHSQSVFHVWRQAQRTKNFIYGRYHTLCRSNQWPLIQVSALKLAYTHCACSDHNSVLNESSGVAYSGSAQHKSCNISDGKTWK
jgi:hypothetical protein